MARRTPKNPPATRAKEPEERRPPEHLDEDATQSSGTGDSEVQHEARLDQGLEDEPAEGARVDYDRDAERPAP